MTISTVKGFNRIKMISHGKNFFLSEGLIGVRESKSKQNVSSRPGSKSEENFQDGEEEQKLFLSGTFSECGKINAKFKSPEALENSLQ